MLPQIVVALIGVWLMAAPAVLGYEGGTADNAHRILGPLIASFGTVAVFQATRGARWVNVPLGGAVAATALLVFLPSEGGPMAVNAVLSGALVAGLSLLGGQVSVKTGGGWRAILWRYDR